LFVLWVFALCLVSLSPCLPVSLSLSPCLSVALSLCRSVCLCACLFLYVRAYNVSQIPMGRDVVLRMGRDVILRIGLRMFYATFVADFNSGALVVEVEEDIY
jgi:hypothetical protein